MIKQVSLHHTKSALCKLTTKISVSFDRYKSTLTEKFLGQNKLKMTDPNDSANGRTRSALLLPQYAKLGLLPLVHHLLNLMSKIKMLSHDLQT
jgi:hypothetical protein